MKYLISLIIMFGQSMLSAQENAFELKLSNIRFSQSNIDLTPDLDDKSNNTNINLINAAVDYNFKLEADKYLALGAGYDYGFQKSVNFSNNSSMLSKFEVTNKHLAILLYAHIMQYKQFQKVWMKIGGGINVNYNYVSNSLVSGESTNTNTGEKSNIYKIRETHPNTIQISTVLATGLYVNVINNLSLGVITEVGMRLSRTRGSIISEFKFYDNNFNLTSHETVNVSQNNISLSFAYNLLTVGINYRFE